MPKFAVQITIHMKKLSLLFAAFVLTLAAFAQNNPKPASKGVIYGEGTTNTEAVSVVDMEKQVQDKGSFTGKITAKVTEVCLEKGCWMKVEKGNGETIMVRFKDYGFFMPKNIVGQTVVLEGEAKEKEVSVKQQQHLAEDAGKTKAEISKIKEVKKETQFIAKGVLVI
jgi:Domain of unknown function (DUF4920)